MCVICSWWLDTHSSQPLKNEVGWRRILFIMQNTRRYTSPGQPDVETGVYKEWSVPTAALFLCQHLQDEIKKEQI